VQFGRFFGDHDRHASRAFDVAMKAQGAFRYPPTSLPESPEAKSNSAALDRDPALPIMIGGNERERQGRS